LQEASTFHPLKQETGMTNQQEGNNDSPEGKGNGTSHENDTVTGQSGTTNGLSPLQVEQEIKKSKVRVHVTYIATAFIFGVGGILIVCLAVKGQKEDALAVFNTILPIAAGIITYWFATRSNRKAQEDSDK